MSATNTVKAGMTRATLRDLEHAVLHREEAPGRVRPDDLQHIVGITAKVLGLNALSKGCAVDLDNGYVLICTVAEKPVEAQG